MGFGLYGLAGGIGRAGHHGQGLAGQRFGDRYFNLIGCVLDPAKDLVVDEELNIIDAQIVFNLGGQRQYLAGFNVGRYIQGQFGRGVGRLYRQRCLQTAAVQRHGQRYRVLLAQCLGGQELAGAHFDQVRGPVRQVIIQRCVRVQRGRTAVVKDRLPDRQLI
ncbi:hypothetical protein GCM10007392_24740 [Saccharospirillum salsuginis]|uniref:Uncharacterized protein n=1 Tax=Saccharospirillum salsuginis TaxID=418750 RepID=A0A918KAI5_9GAMM|nr:hypothetical protein GCM10007392_24740 [Saccharospirillum salsuginis]